MRKNKNNNKIPTLGLKMMSVFCFVQKKIIWLNISCAYQTAHGASFGIFFFPGLQPEHWIAPADADGHNRHAD